MKVTNEKWTVKRIGQMATRINPKTQYQRGAVWKPSAQQLLIDSILCHFDIPKVYLHDMRGVGIHDYDVTDGQQRLNAIWAFLKDALPLGDVSYHPNPSWKGKRYSELPKQLRDQVDDFEFVVAVITNATSDEVRELFSRLQRGVRLSPAELRNSIPSQMGDAVRAIAENHAFFTDDACPFSNERFKHHDLCAYAFALELYKGQKDMKAPTLKRMFEEYASQLPASIPRKVNQILTYFHDVHNTHPKCIRTKWGFIDLYWLASEQWDRLPASEKFGTTYVRFEARRRKYSAEPKELLLPEGGGSVPQKDQRLFDYITAFQASGGTAENVRQRHKVLKKELV